MMWNKTSQNLKFSEECMDFGFHETETEHHDEEIA